MSELVILFKPSAACAGNMHSNCVGCGCDCHRVCDRCNRPCQVTYTPPNDPEQRVCAFCYRQATRNAPRSRCEEPGCVSTHAYRDVKCGDDRYLCMMHHVGAGHGSGRPLDDGADER